MGGMNWTRLAGRELFRAGDYGAKGAYTPADLEVIAANTRGRGELQLDLHHANTDRSFDLGRLDAASVRVDGDRIVGDVLVDPHDLERDRFRARGLSVVLNRAAKAITKLTVTPIPEVPSASFSASQAEAEGDIIFDGGQLMPEEITTPAGAAPADEAGLFRRFLNWVKQQPAADPPPAPLPAEPAFSADDLSAKIEAAVASAVAAAEAKFEARLAPVNADRLASEIAFHKSRGVQPWLAEGLVNLREAVSTEVAFSAPAANGELRTVSVAEFVNDLLASDLAKVTTGPQFAATDTQTFGTGEAAFSQAAQLDARAKELMAARPDITPQAAHLQAIDEAQRAKGGK